MGVDPLPAILEGSPLLMGLSPDQMRARARALLVVADSLERGARVRARCEAARAASREMHRRWWLHRMAVGLAVHPIQVCP